MTKNLKFAVIGGGSWATAIVKIITDNNRSNEVIWWMRSQEAIDHLKKYRRNPRYLSYIEINIDPENITSDLKEAISLADVIVLAVPAAFLQEALSEIISDDLAGKIVVSAIKGFVNNSVPLQMMPAMKATSQTNTFFGLLLSFGIFLGYFI